MKKIRKEWVIASAVDQSNPWKLFENDSAEKEVSNGARKILGQKKHGTFRLTA